MKKYTVIYAEFFQIGSHQNSITKLEYIECFPEFIKDEIEKFVSMGNVWFILEGHCNQTND